MKTEKSVCKLRKANKYSYSVTIPKIVIKKYGWREKQKLTIVDRDRGKIEISDWKRR